MVSGVQSSKSAWTSTKSQPAKKRAAHNSTGASNKHSPRKHSVNHSTDFPWKPGRNYSKTSKNSYSDIAKSSTKSHVTTGKKPAKNNNGYKYDARREGGNKGWDPKFAKLGIAYNDPHGNYLSNVLLSAASGIQQRVGYAVPRGASEFGRSLIRALNNRRIKSLSQALSKFSFRDIMGGGLWQKPIYQRAEKANGQDFSKSVFNMSSANKKKKDIKNVFLGANGNDGGNINFRGELKKVAKAFRKKFGADLAGLLNNPSRKAIANGFKRIANWAKRHKDKAVNLAFYYSGHGNWNHDGRKQGAATSWNQNFSEKWLKRTIARVFKGVKNVGINLLIAACHAGGSVC